MTKFEEQPPANPRCLSCKQFDNPDCPKGPEVVWTTFGAICDRFEAAKDPRVVLTLNKEIEESGYRLAKQEADLSLARKAEFLGLVSNLAIHLLKNGWNVLKPIETEFNYCFKEPSSDFCSVIIPILIMDMDVELIIICSNKTAKEQNWDSSVVLYVRVNRGHSEPIPVHGVGYNVLNHRIHEFLLNYFMNKSYKLSQSRLVSSRT